MASAVAFVLCGLVALLATPSLSVPITRPSTDPAHNHCHATEQNEWNVTNNWNESICEIRLKATGVKLLASDIIDEITHAIRFRSADMGWIRTTSFIEHQLGVLNSIATSQEHGDEPASTQQRYVALYALLLGQLQNVEGIIDNSTVIKNISTTDPRVNNVVNGTSTVILKMKELLCAIRTSIGSRDSRGTTADRLDADFNHRVFRMLGGEGYRAYIVMADTVKLMNAIIQRTNYVEC